MREHLRWFGTFYLVLLIMLLVIGGAAWAFNSWGESRGVECGRAGGVTMEWEYDAYGNPSAVWCLDENGDAVNVPEWN